MKIRFIRLGRGILSLACLLAFICMEHPSILSKIQHANMQSFSLLKTTIIVGSEIILFVCLVLTTQSFRWFKFLIATVLSFSTLFFDVYYYASGKVIEFQEFLLLYQSKANLFDAISMYRLQILESMPRICILWIGLYMPPPLGWCKRKILFLSCFLFLSLISLVTTTCIFKQGTATNKLPAPISLYGLWVAYSYDHIQNPHTYCYQGLSVDAEFPSGYEHIILIVDESVRWDYSPFLRLKNYGQWEVYDYGCATSYANASATSNILLRKGARFEHVAFDFYNNPLIWDYAKKAGYTTYLIDNQCGGKGHDYFDSIEQEMIDHNIIPPSFRDGDIWKKMPYLHEKKKTFTLIIKRGSHFPYIDFPNDQKIDFVMSEYQKASSKRIAYLKSITFQSDDFWKDFFKIDIVGRTLIIYTSDHGQNLEDVEGLTHGTSAQQPYIGEGLVPLVVLSNTHNYKIAENFTTNINHASHFNIFPTLIEAMGYAPKKLGYINKNSSLSESIVPVDGFYYGIPFGYFGKEPNFYQIR